jgi:hypothetical protein
VHQCVSRLWWNYKTHLTCRESDSRIVLECSQYDRLQLVHYKGIPAVTELITFSSFPMRNFMVENRNHSSIWNTVDSITEVVPQCAPISIDFYRHYSHHYCHYLRWCRKCYHWLWLVCCHSLDNKNAGKGRQVDLWKYSWMCHLGSSVYELLWAETWRMRTQLDFSIFVCVHLISLCHPFIKDVFLVPLVLW